MADISMCRNFECDRNNDCYRFKAKADNTKQSYSNYNEVGCIFFWRIPGTKAIEPIVDNKKYTMIE